MPDRCLHPPGGGGFVPPPPFLPLGPPDPGTARTALAADPDFPVYLVEADRADRIALARDISAAGFETRPFADAADLAAAIPELAPGCVVLDIKALAAGPSALRERGGAGPFYYPTILLYSSIEAEEAVAAVRLGAADLLPRPVSVGDLVRALRRAAPKVCELARRLAAGRARAALDALTRREREVMECIMEGLSNKRMAYVLGISPRTIEMHRARLNRRLRIGSVAELLALGWLARSAV